TSGKSILFATVHRAAMKFYYGNCLGVHRPVLADSKTKIAVKDENASWGTGCCWGTWSHQGVIPDIIIAYPANSTPSDYIIGTTIHELAHQSHLLFMNLGTYIQLGKEIHESWAAAVEWAFLNDYYRTDLNAYTNGHYDRADNLYFFSKQNWEPGTMNGGKSYCYTPLFIDLIDNCNQSLDGYYRRPDDKISGYSLQYIQNNILPSAYGLSSCYNSVKNHKINGVTNQDIDDLFHHYWGYNYSR
ncbi:MAG: hypothetical protein SPL42_07625, partial [Bacteroidales bacterium]|nr:hypothetical protein [Bacteroidales bacterium]